MQTRMMPILIQQFLIEFANILRTVCAYWDTITITTITIIIIVIVSTYRPVVTNNTANNYY